MADIVSKEKRSQMMAGIKSKNTRPEILVRKLLHSAGFRYRLHDKSLSGKPDLVLKKYHLAIFVNGCFWHGHENCHLFRLPKSRTEFWKTKINGNIERDLSKVSVLNDAGWRTLVVWECALKGRRKLSQSTLLKTMEEMIHDVKKNHLDISG